ncbi:MAG: LysR family transcriptional regulator [Rubrivivax sp.]|nr:LysR family transcriptional regulator [Rubrivivax sp.]
MNFRTLDLNLLRVFDVVMTERSVTRAAVRLSMTQPAVSNALRRLREATDQDLFTATPTGVTPTRQAQALWPSVRAALGGLREVFEPQDFDPRNDARSFTLAMADATAAVIVPALVRDLSAEQAKADLRFIPLASRDPRLLLEHGEADLALGFFPELPGAIAAEGDASPMQLEHLWGCEYVCVMRHDHPLAAQRTLTLDAFCAAKHLRVSFAGRPRGFVDDALQRLGRQRQVMITVNQFHSAGCVVRQSDLLTVLPRSFVPATGFADELTWRKLPFEMPGIDVALLWHRRHHRDAAQRWLRDRLRQAAVEMARSSAPANAARLTDRGDPVPQP